MLTILDNLGATCDRYSVIIDDTDPNSDVYDLSFNADCYNGVCQYAGELCDYGDYWKDWGIEVSYDALPTGTQKAIQRILASEAN